MTIENDLIKVIMIEDHHGRNNRCELVGCFPGFVVSSLYEIFIYLGAAARMTMVTLFGDKKDAQEMFSKMACCLVGDCGQFSVWLVRVQQAVIVELKVM